MIRAILWAQLLSMRPRTSRSAGLGIVVGAIWYSFWIFAACWAGVFAAKSPAQQLSYGLPIGLLAICFYWQAIPVLSASMGSSLDLRKLLVYPVPHQKLFFVEVLLRLTAGAEMVLVLTGGCIGLLFNRAEGGWTSAPRIVAAGLVFVVFNLFLASGTRSLLERLLARRKVREVVAFLLAMLWMGPRLAMLSGVSGRWFERAGASVGTVGWPWSATAHELFPGGGMMRLDWAVMAVWTATAWWFGRVQFERNIRYDALAAQAMPIVPMTAKEQARRDWFYRVPGLLWRDPLAAMVEKELRSLTRSPRFRMVFVMGVSFGLMLWLPMNVGRERVPGAGGLARHLLPIVCVYSMTMMGQVTFWNSFGLDRSAVAFYFAAPQPLSRVLMGKNIACLFFVYLETAVLAVVTFLVRGVFAVAPVVEAIAVVGVCSVYLFALGNISSVRFPRMLSPERVSQSGAGARGQVLVMLLYPVVLMPVGMAYLAGYAFESRAAFGMVLGLAAAIGGIVYWLSMESAVSAAGKLRQEILAELSRGEGPVAS